MMASQDGRFSTSQRAPILLYALFHVVWSPTGVESFYSRYPAYPPYCSTPEEMETRAIPPLEASKRVGESRVLHVSAIFRHGARTPWGNTLNCWDDYWSNPETGVWNCNLTSHAASSGTTIFEKRYDALFDPPLLSNALNGTCQVGQLLDQGYDQELRNGQFLRDAYLYDATSFTHDTRMRLLDLGKPNPWNEVSLRSDDEARTLLSGQLVLNGMLEPELRQYHSDQGTYPIIPLHTADFQRDIMDPNEKVCPKLAIIAQNIRQSTGFTSMDQSAEHKLLRKFQHEVLHIPNPDIDMHALDCLMTTICTDRPLPSALDDFGRNATTPHPTFGSNLFQRLAAMNARQYTYHIKANDAEYSKLGIGPLWYEIVQNIYTHIHEGETSSNKLALFSGHDTTIMPLLASLDPALWADDDWPPYASMVLIEVHEVNIDRNTDKKVFKSNFAFRLLFNGNVITPKMQGCSPDLELCDLDVLLERVEPFAALDIDCAAKLVGSGSIAGNGLFLALLPLFGMAVGGLLVYIYFTRSIPFQKKRICIADHDGLVLSEMNGERFEDPGDDGSLT